MAKIITIAVFVLLIAGLCIGGFFIIKDLNEPAQNQNAPGMDYETNHNGEPNDIFVSLVVDDYCAVLGESSVRVEPGRDVVFEVIFDNNYVFDSLDNEAARYLNGKVTVSGVTESTTVNLKSKCIAAMFDFSIYYPSTALGTVQHSVGTGAVLENTIVSVTAIPAEGKTFIGWSDGAAIIDGGKVLSYATSYSLNVTRDIKLYPNFLEEGYTIIKYDLNGGTTADGSSTVILTQFKAGNHRCPNLIADNGTIVRDGYTLIEFTENQDGTGEAINPGGMTKLPSEGNILTFYAQWSKWTDPEFFTYEVAANNVTITGYLSDDPVLSIPARINGMPVTRLESNCVRGRNFETLVIPSSVVSTGSKVFIDCKQFNTLYITDSFTSIPNDIFVTTKTGGGFSVYTPENLRLNASIDPYFVTHAENVGMRLETLLTREDERPVMMFVGGSSCLHGVKAEYLEAKLDYKYQVLNAGTNAGGLGVLYMEGLAHYMRPDDIIVNVPEYGANQMGGTEFVWRVFRATVTCYNLFRYINFANYTNFFVAMSEYNTAADARYAGKPQTYDTKCTSLTPVYCDLAGKHGPAANPNFSSQNVKESNLSDAKIAVINRLISQLEAYGITFYFSCAPVCDGTGTQSTADGIEKYYQRTVNKLNCPVISNPANYRYKKELYYNSSYHLCYDAAIDRTDKLYLDLLAQFAKEAEE